MEPSIVKKYIEESRAANSRHLYSSTGKKMPIILNLGCIPSHVSSYKIKHKCLKGDHRQKNKAILPLCKSYFDGGGD